MTNQPQTALIVTNLAKSITFYVDDLGFTLGKQLSADIAEIIAAEDDVMLLAGPQAGDVVSYLTKEHLILKPGDDQGLAFFCDDLDILQMKLLQKGFVHLKLLETLWGDRKLELQDPDGYHLQFAIHAQRSPMETLAWYAKSIDELEASVSGLADEDLDLSREQGSWPIRHIVHHLADSETLFVWWMKLTLSEPDRFYRQNWPTSNKATSLPVHNKGDITPSLALVRATRSHILQLVQDIPDAWEHATVNEEGHKTSFGDLVNLITSHTLEHITEIMQTRQVHKK